MEGADFSKFEEISEIYKRTMESLKSAYENKLNALYALYFDTLNKLKKEPVYASHIGIRPFETLENELREENNRDLRFMKNDSEDYKTLEEEYKTEKIDEAFIKRIRLFLKGFCGLEMSHFTDEIDEAEKKIKNLLNHKAYPVLTRSIIELKLDVTIRDTYEPSFILQAIEDISDVVARDSLETDTMKVASESMRKEKARVDEELKTLQNSIAQRVGKSTTPHPNAPIEALFQKFEHEMAKCHKKIEDTVRNRFIHPKLDICGNMSKIFCIHSGIRTRKLSKTVEINIRLYTEPVLQLAIELNDLLKKINH